MKTQRIYLDASVIGGCFDAEFSKWLTALFSDFRNKIYIPVLSDLVEAEIQDAPEDIKSKLYELLEMGFKPIDIYSPREVTTYEQD